MLETIGLIKAIGGLIGNPIKNWSERKRIKVETETAILKAKSAAVIKSAERGEIHEQDLETVLVKNAGWKDEYWTIVISIPLILCFIPDMAQYVYSGFEALDKTPWWYQSICGIVIGAPFGVRWLGKAMTSKALKVK